jgi:hypothetical protein
MYRKIPLLALMCIGVASTYAFDLKLINNSSSTHKIRVSSYKGLRDVAGKKDPHLKLLVCPPTADLNTFLKNYTSTNYNVSVRPHSSLVIEDLMPQEQVKVGGTLLWHEVPLDEVKQHTQKAPFKQKGGTFFPSYKRYMGLIIFSSTTTGYTFDTCFKKTTSRTEPCTPIEDAYRPASKRAKISPIK